MVLVFSGDGIPRLRSVFQDLQDAEARAAAVWMVGYWGAEIQEAPYILEKIIDAYVTTHLCPCLE